MLLFAAVLQKLFDGASRCLGVLQQDGAGFGE